MSQSEAGARDIRVLIVDDQTLVRMGFRMLLDAEPGIEVIAEAADGAEAVRIASAQKPDVVLMDVRMPGLDGIAATAEILRLSPGTRVLILTTFDLDEYAFGGLRAGASGFLLKDTRPTELLAAVRAVAAGEAAISPRVTRRMLDLFGARMPAPQGGPLETLTPREHEILLAIGEGLSNGEIGERFVLSESTVKTHVGRVLMKLELRDRVQAVIFAFEHGLVG
ncbi:response regulator transcription factor [Glaciihabitans arcticus]|uniref:Response regulator transcription factor n=1 Tax=Glaciihabitans arcticus TaxID=2668039 RepID=A0A4Q9GWM7_9MICO|nr:response regulator transcription factor [Glaciihabitans arcticus]TBN57103.1 response regulator transcription factor [Glaciihabitans arcticus]